VSFTFCPECDTPIDVGDSPFIGMKVKCRKCSANLEIINLSPIELDWIDDDYGEIVDEQFKKRYDYYH
jgi:predicted Zn finger-like uncharacterized protein